MFGTFLHEYTFAQAARGNNVRAQHIGAKCPTGFVQWDHGGRDAGVRRGGKKGAPDEKDPAARLRPGPKTTFFSLRATHYARGGIVGWMRSR